jgi:hypothetical protein
MLRTAQDLLPASHRSLRVHGGGTRTCATPQSESEAIIVTQGHAVKRCVVLTADLGVVRGSIQPDVYSCVMTRLRPASATSAVRSGISETLEICDPVFGWHSYHYHRPCQLRQHSKHRGRGVPRHHSGATADQAGDVVDTGDLEAFRCYEPPRIPPIGWRNLPPWAGPGLQNPGTPCESVPCGPRH